jgi:hypothetical protein
MTLFDPGPTDPTPPPAPKLSPDRARTERNRRLLADGRHPITRMFLADGDHPAAGHTCGDCDHHFIHQVGHRYHKCELRYTGGAATDLRVSWPACTLWQPEVDAP